MNLQELIAKFLGSLQAERGYSAQTCRAYSSDLEQFLQLTREALGVDHPMVEQITAAEVRGFVTAMHRKGFARRTIGRRLTAVKSMMKYAVATGVVQSNPAALVSAPKVEKRLPTLLSRSEVDELMNLPDRSTPAGLRDAAILELLYATGIRRSELCGLRLSDLDLAEGTVRVLGKGNRDRVVPIGNVAATAIRLWLQRRDELVVEGSLRSLHDPLFLRDDGKPLDGNGLYAIVRHYMQGVTEQKKKSPHVLRHSFATHMLDNGAGLREVAEMLGHASLSTTQVYTHVTVDRLRQAYSSAHPRAGTEPSEEQKEDRKENGESSDNG